MRTFLALSLALVLGPAAMASEPYCPPEENPHGPLETPLPTYRLVSESGTEVVYHFVLQRRPGSHCTPATTEPVEGQNWLAMLRWTEANGWYLVTSMSCDVAETFEQTYGLATATLTASGDGFVMSCAQTDSDIYEPEEGPWNVRSQVTSLLGEPIGAIQERLYTDYRPRLGDGFINGESFDGHGPGTVTLLTENGFVDTDIGGCRIFGDTLLATPRAGGLTGVVCQDKVHVFDGTTRLQSHQLARGENEQLLAFRMVEHGGTVMGAFAVRVDPESDSTFLIATLDDLRVAEPVRQEHAAPNLRSATFLAGENGLDAIWLQGPLNDEHTYPIAGLLDLGLDSGDWTVLDSELVAYTAYSSARTDDAWFVWSEYGANRELLLLSISGSGVSRTIINALGELSYLPYPYSTFWQYCIDDNVRYTCWDDSAE